MLEESIAELTKAVLALTYALNQAYAAPVPVASHAPKSFTAEIEKEIGKTIDAMAKAASEGIEEREAVKKVEGVPNEKPKTTTATSQPSESESAAVSYDDVKKATNALSAAKGRDATIAVLSRFGVKKATELDAAQWADYIEHAGKVTEGADV